MWPAPPHSEVAGYARQCFCGKIHAFVLNSKICSSDYQVRDLEDRHPRPYINVCLQDSLLNSLFVQKNRVNQKNIRRCVHQGIGREIIEYTVKYGEYISEYIQIWPTLYETNAVHTKMHVQHTHRVYDRSNTVNIYRSGQPYVRQTLCTPKCTYSIHTVFMIGQIQWIYTVLANPTWDKHCAHRNARTAHTPCLWWWTTVQVRRSYLHYLNSNCVCALL